MPIESADVELIDLLRRTIPGATEIRQLVAQFRVVRFDKNGDMQLVDVEIFDSGSGPHRFSCMATTTDGKTATGNPEETLELALEYVHWRSLG